MVKEIAGLLPVSTWKFQPAHGVFATAMRDRAGPSPAIAFDRDRGHDPKSVTTRIHANTFRILKRRTNSIILRRIDRWGDLDR